MDGAKLRASFDRDRDRECSNPLNVSPPSAASGDGGACCVDPLTQLAQQLEACPSVEDLLALSEEELLLAMSEACISTLLKNRVLQRIAQEKQVADVAAHVPGDEGADGEHNNADGVENVPDDDPPRPGFCFLLFWAVVWSLEIVALVFLHVHTSNLADVLDATGKNSRRCTLWGAETTCTADGGWAADGTCDGTIDVALYHTMLDTLASAQLPAAEPLAALTSGGGLAVLASSSVCPAAMQLGRAVAKDEASTEHDAEVMMWKWHLHDPVTAPELLRQHLRVSLSARLGGRWTGLGMRSYADGSGLCVGMDEGIYERNITHFSLAPVNNWGLEANHRYTLTAATTAKRRFIGATIGNTLDLWESADHRTVWTWPSATVPRSWLAYLNPPTSSALNMCASHHSVKGSATSLQALNSLGHRTAQQSTCHIDHARQQCHLGLSVKLGLLSMDLGTASVVGSVIFWLMFLHCCAPFFDLFTGFRLSRHLVAVLVCCTRGPNAEERAARRLFKIWKVATYLSSAGVYYGFVVTDDGDTQAFMMHSEFKPEAAMFRWNSDRWAPIPHS